MVLARQLAISGADLLLVGLAAYSQKLVVILFGGCRHVVKPRAVTAWPSACSIRPVPSALVKALRAAAGALHRGARPWPPLSDWRDRSSDRSIRYVDPPQ